MDTLTDSPAALQRRYDELQQLRQSIGTPDVVEALAECAFRLAIVPGTPFETAVDYLQRASAWDRGNPKYSYYIAVVFLEHGHVVRAGEQLQSLHRTYPTSHRIWTHIAVIQRELNYGYIGNAHVEQRALSERSSKLLALVRQGIDYADEELVSVTPPPVTRPDVRPAVRSDAEPDAERERPPTRKTDPGRCRWSGAYDVYAEHLLEGEPSIRNRDLLADVLDMQLRLAEHRIGGYTAFVVTSIQWILAGYPVGQISRLLSSHRQNFTEASRALFELVVDLMLLPDRNLPARLAAAVETGSLPATLAALIHDRRLLYKHANVVEHRDAYWSATRFLNSRRRADNDEERAKELELAIQHRLRIRNAANSLNAKPPSIPEAERDSVSEGLDATTELIALEADASRLKQRATGLFEFIRNDLAKRLEGAEVALDLVEADRLASVSVLDQIGLAAHSGRARLEAITKTVASGAAVDSFTERKEECDRTLTDLLNRGRFDRVLKKIEQSVTAKGGDVQPAPNVSAQLAALQDSSQPFPFAPEFDAGRADTKEPATLREATAPADRAMTTTSMDAFAMLRSTLKEFDAQVDRLFAEARCTFDPYGEPADQPQALLELRLTVLSTQAQLLYSLGRRRSARALWLSISTEDRLDPKPLHNVAVCDMVVGDADRSLTSWQAYIEAEYFRAIVNRRASEGADARASLHRAFAAALGPQALRSSERPSETRGEPADVVSFLASAARVRAFVDHTLLDFWNARFELTSHSLLLGIGRTGTERQRDAAAQQLYAFILKAWPLLPQRVADRIADLAWEHIEDAAQYSHSSPRSARRSDSKHDQEERTFKEWLQRLIELKARFHYILLNSSSSIFGIESLETLGDLVRLDDIPLDTNIEWRDSVARGYFPPRSFDELQTLMRSTCERLFQQAVYAATSPTDEKRLGDERQKLYERIGKSWFASPLFESMRELFDNPGRLPGFYSKEITDAFEDAPADVIRKATEALVPLVALVPYSGGPAHDLAWLLLLVKDAKKALTVLDGACTRVVWDQGRRECEKLLAQLRFNDAMENAEQQPERSFDQILSVMRGGLLEREDAPNGLVNVAVLFAQKTGNWGRYDELRNALTSWRGRAKPPEKEPTSPPTETPDVTRPWRRTLVDRAQTEPRLSAEFERMEVPVFSAYRHRDAGIAEQRSKVDPDVDPHVISYLLSAANPTGDGNLRWQAVYDAMDDFLKYHEGVSAVHWRMVAAFRLAAADISQRGRYIPSARRDAAEVKAVSTDPQERERAEQVLEAIARA